MGPHDHPAFVQRVRENWPGLGASYGPPVSASATRCGLGVALIAGLGSAVLALQPTWLVAVLALLVAAGGLILASMRPAIASVVLLVASVPFLRPFILGEDYSTLAPVLALSAVAVSLPDGVSLPRPSLVFLGWWTAAWLWFSVQTTWGAQEAGPIGSGWVTIWLPVAAAVLVLGDLRRRRMFTKALVGLVLVLCAAFAVTFAMWLLGGFGSFRIATLPLGYEAVANGTTPLYFPLTPTYSQFEFGGVVVPRMLGMGRESGIMAVLIGWSWFTLRRIGWTNSLWKVMLLVGLAGTQSTAGFAVFLIVGVVGWLFTDRPGYWSIGMRRTLGVVVLSAAVVTAYFVPVYGLAAKSQLNAASVDDRQRATVTGLESLWPPIGRAPYSYEQLTGINLVAAVTVIGAFGAVLLAAALLHPLMTSPERAAALPAVGFVFLTTLTSQPPQFSGGFFLITSLAAMPLARSAIGPSDQESLHREEITAR